VRKTVRREWLMDLVVALLSSGMPHQQVPPHRRLAGTAQVEGVRRVYLTLGGQRRSVVLPRSDPSGVPGSSENAVRYLGLTTRRTRCRAIKLIHK